MFEKILGLFLLILGVILCLGAIIGGLGGVIICLVWSIQGALALIRGDVEANFTNIFWMLLLFFGREIIAAVILITGFGSASACISTGLNLLQRTK